MFDSAARCRDVGNRINGPEPGPLALLSTHANVPRFPGTKPDRHERTKAHPQQRTLLTAVSGAAQQIKSLA
jgi:hypothetical protein